MNILSGYLVFCLLWTAAFGFTLANDSCSGRLVCLPSYTYTAIRTERDVSYNVSIDQNSYFGIRLQPTIFHQSGYTDLGLDALSEALELGYTLYHLDVYWSEANSSWQLCPGKLPSGGGAAGQTVQVKDGDGDEFKCQTNVTIASVLERIAVYISQTDNNLAVSSLLLELDLHSLNGTDQKKGGTPKYQLSDLIRGIFGNKLYTPSNLAYDRQHGETYDDNGESADGFPTSHYFLLEIQKRILVSARNVSLAATASYNVTNDTDAMFIVSSTQNDTPYFGNHSYELHYTNSSYDACKQLLNSSGGYLEEIESRALQSWRTLYDVPDMPFNSDNLDDFVRCGYTPVLNTPLESLSELVPTVDQAMWSWAPQEPSTVRNSSTSTNNGPVAYKCALLYEDGWRVGNCYEKYRPLCRVGEKAYEWKLGDKPATYFDADEACIDNTTFSVPRTTLQNTAAIKLVQGLSALNDTDFDFPVWIDMNSISVDDCWVTGGPYAQCSYRISFYNRNKVAQIAVGGAVIVVLLGIILLLRMDKVPLRRARFRWKRLSNKPSSEEYEGVPA
ncbi:maintenance of telomere capping protein 6 [Trichomonascus vanleenenianus]|uniref:Mtc6p n=1 Tax=Trichomonascus vanleenenianus TaxID=2268995 RepID=UPI003EC992CD